MRALSEDEKLVIIKLMEGKKSISDLFDFTNYEGYLIEYKIDPYSGKKEINILVDSSIDMNVALERFMNLQLSFARTLNVINYLIKENYLFVINMAHGQSIKGNMGSKTELEKYNKEPSAYRTEIPIPENFIIPSIISLIDKQIISTKALEDFHQSGFKTKDEIQFQKTHLVSKIALGTAIIIGVVSILISYCK